MKLLMLVAASCAFVFARAQTLDDITLDSIIPPGEQKKMGISKLTTEEREALRRYFVSRISEIFKAGFEKGQMSQVNARVASPPKKETYIGTGSEHWLKQNIDRGAMLLLEDGSLWDVDPLDKIDAMLWLPITNVRVLESTKGSPGYDYLIVNTDDGEKVHAKYRGKR
ncbi:hypothetical protein [Horticoccus sp. 23ND18S-11]|uniref:hypothetical protein n=1 Tax=Horticoccus sp. 23ND18S-11 TaxID=3391832 RepID=UPI0039C9A04D